jgi:hypothetical protein
MVQEALSSNPSAALAPKKVSNVIVILYLSDYITHTLIT